jgi:hypothetical protein
MKSLKNTLKRKYHYLRQRYLTSHNDKPARLIIEKAKWYNDADSPVMLMIDDLANAWHSSNGGNVWDFGGDWGGGLSDHGSAFLFLRENLLDDFPEVKITFFTVMGKINSYTFNKPFAFSEPFNRNKESMMFLRSLHESERFEIAYHGYDHGTPGETATDFVQEWEGFRSINDACEQNRKGKEIYKGVLGEFPAGGKYGGWKHNEFADQSIDRSGFIWWCRDWTPRDITGSIPDGYYEPQFFGENLVVALPSTLHGFYWSKKQVDNLLRKKQIISIEEHIAPIRPDGLIQTPNIIDDINELRSIYAYLRGKKVWYATGIEIARYFISFSFTTIYDITQNGFKIKYTGRVEKPVLTIIIEDPLNSDFSFNKIILPDGKELDNFVCSKKKRNAIFVNLPLQNGLYRLM